MAVHLRDQDREILEKIFSQCFCQSSVEVLVYGSRTRGQSHETSDLDLVIRCRAQEKVDLKKFDSCIDLVKKSMIPLVVELRDYYGLPETFRDEIDRTGQVLWENIS